MYFLDRRIRKNSDGEEDEVEYCVLEISEQEVFRFAPDENGKIVLKSSIKPQIKPVFTLPATQGDNTTSTSMIPDWLKISSDADWLLMQTIVQSK